ncbi:transcriptional regulator [Xanthomonas hyacinthi]|uniref:Transcriptional regulator n=1 Tax=Xanthomonas hyacinthi TaxID=56455 RepID=A0A2S7EZS6_9XANT|nr:winged helix-turn-helix domain-containing protein [Xanthomonas hyacinthi]PPU98680.1 transcriptional regulator [Xanthomonas hyacinthi]QGY77498.1 transcriptional regulator [Xanthomonas hyacinthi]
MSFRSPATPLLPERMQVGDCLVLLSLREVHAPHARRPQRLTPKAMGVLRVLLAQPGQVVERETLLAQVWPDTQPSNDVVTQAITQLRKAFAAGAKGDAPAYIETLAKTGYRLVAPLQALAEVEADASAQAAAAVSEDMRADADAAVPVAADAASVPAAVVPAPPLRRVQALLAAVAGAGLMLLAMLSWWLPRDGQDPAGSEQERVVGSPERPYRLIVTTPGFELEPALSPNGAQLAYAAGIEGRAGTQLLVQATGRAAGGALPRPLGVPGKGDSDRLPAWSPDGRRIAFARLGPDGQCQVLLVAADGHGAAREATRCDGTELLSFDWTPDGRGLLFGSMTGRQPGRGIRVLDLASGRWRALPYPVAAGDFDYAPRYSPDGQWIAFVRNPQMGGLWRMPAAGGRAEPLTREFAEIRGWDWTQDGRGLVFGRRVDSETRLYRLDTASQRLRDLDLGDAQSPTLSRDGERLAFVHRRPQFALYRIAAADRHGKRERQRLFASTGRDSQPVIAPDGQQLAFTSDRSGSYALWWGEVTRPQSLRQIEGLRPEIRQAPAWSADSQSLLVSGRDAQGRSVLYEVRPQSGSVVPLPVPSGEPLQALYTADPAQLLVLLGENGRTRLQLYDRRSVPWRRLAALDDVSQLRVDADSGQVLFTRLARSGLWRADATLDPASVAVVDAAVPSLWRYRTWALGAGGEVRYLFPTGECASRLARIGGGLGDSVCLDRDRLSSLNGFSIDRRSGDVYASLAVEDGSDIGFMRMPERTGWFSVITSKWLLHKGK